MTKQAIVIFIIFNILNVIIQTIKSIVTIKSGKFTASIISAIAYGLYTYIVILTADDGVSLWFKILTVAIANLIGVFIVKLIEEKTRKDKLWKVELTVPTQYVKVIDIQLKDIPHSYIIISDKHTLFNFYCATKQDSSKVKSITKQYDARYFITESKSI